ncbi:transposase [Xanthomonas euroxanthea]|uniref:transposase n=1 Tax=Xanthomonas euroxanthea TaxID=2259622 RepID=UPI00161D7848
MYLYGVCQAGELTDGLNNKIRVVQRSAYGYRNQDFLKLTSIASLLPPLPKTLDGITVIREVPN